MNGSRRADRNALYAGLALIGVGLAARRVVELTLVSDGRIESLGYSVLIAAIQLVSIAAGLLLVLRRPAIRTPGKAELALLLSSVVLAVVALEIGARLWLDHLATPAQYDRYVLLTDIAAEDFAFIPHPYLSYAPAPGYRKGATFHNSLGYRNDEFPLEKPDGVYRIVALGGSSTYDVRIENNSQTFTARLEQLLKEEYGYPQVQVINAGVPGYNSWEILVNLEFRVLDLDPDLLIIYEGTNDAHARLVEPSAYRGDNSGRRQVWRAPPLPLWERSALLRIASRSMNRSRQLAVDDFVSSPTYLSWPFESRLEGGDADAAGILRQNPPIYFRRNLENMVAIANEHQVKILLATWASSPFLNDYAAKAYYQEAFRENNQVVTEVANSHDAIFFDFAALMSLDARYWADGRHSNEAGAQLKAALFAEFIYAQGLIDQ